jgi:hypothetical protein
MIGKGLFTQLVMLAVSVAIVITFIQPKFIEITEVQDSISIYQQKRGEVLSVNSKLASLVSSLDGVSSADQRKLFDYLPDEVDSISVVRDLYLISNQAGVFYGNANFFGPTLPDNDGKSSFGNPTPYSFELSVEGTYSQVKELLSLLENNYYPLEVQGLDITKLDGGFLSVSLNIVTYAYDDSLTRISTNEF